MTSTQPPKIPDQFTAAIERVVIQGNNETQRIGSQLYMDFGSDIYRIDVTHPLVNEDKEKYGDAALSLVYDYKASKLCALQ